MYTKMEEKSSKTRKFMKILCLFSLMLQNAAYALILKYVRSAEKPFISSTAVCVAEILKLFFSIVLMITFDKSSIREICTFFYNSIAKTPYETLRVLVSAVGYIVMTNLTYYSNTNLDLITFLIISQLRIPATVIFAIIILRSNFRKLQYTSLIVLTVGVIIVQMTEVKEHGSRRRELNRTLGIIAGVIASALSGFAGVYFEKILKSTNASVWARNVQLSVISIPPAFALSLVYDWKQINEDGFFYGYNELVWVMVFLQAFGGMIIALSMKLADNVSKGYATSLSIVLSVVSSFVIFHYRFNYLLGCGAVLVVTSIPMYAYSNMSVKIEPMEIDSEGRECYI